MPTVYRVEVSADAEEKEMDPSLAGVVTFDGKKTGRIMPGHYQALLIGDEMKPLPHPVEWSTLRSYGQTYLSASLRGILLEVERRICLRCGHVFDAPRVVFSVAVGCLLGLLAAAIAFAYFRFALGRVTGESLFDSLGVLIGVGLLVQLAGFLYIRARFSERQANIQQRQCPVCHGTNCASISSMVGKRVQTGTGEKWVQVSIAGKS